MLRSARLLEMDLADDGALEVARRSRGTPRIANRLLRRLRDYADIRAADHQGGIDARIADAALSMLDVDTVGLDLMDRKLLLAVIEKFGVALWASTTWLLPLAKPATPLKMCWSPS